MERSAHASVVKLLGELRSEYVLASPKAPDHFDELTDEIKTLTKVFMVPGASERWDAYKLSRTQVRLADCLYSHLGKIVFHETLMDALYSARSKDPPTEKNISVQIFKTRVKLKGSGYRIETAAGMGYSMVSEWPPIE